MQSAKLSEFDIDWSSQADVRAFLTQNLDLVPSVIHKKCRRLLAFHDLDELMSEGYMGFVRAAKTYRPDLGIRFSTYAFRCIYQSLLDFSRKEHLHRKREESGSSPEIVRRATRPSRTASQVTSILMDSTVFKSENLRKQFKLGVYAEQQPV